jgi:hypothetical protein
VTVTSLSGLDYIGAATAGTDELWLRAYNGSWSGWAQANITDLGPPPPVVTAINPTVMYNQAYALGAIFNVSGSGITQYQVWFSDPQLGAPAFGSVTDSGGKPILLNQAVTLTSLSGVNYIGSGTPGTDKVWLKAYDGNWSNWVLSTITDPGVAPPTVNANSPTVTYNQSVPLSNTFTVGGGVTQYQVWFSDPALGAPALGTVTNNNQPIPLNQAVPVTSLSGLNYVGSATAGTDAIWLKAFDGQWSNWVKASITDVGVTPAAVTASKPVVAGNQSIPLSSIFSVSGSGVTAYEVWFSDPQLGAPALGSVTDGGSPIQTNQPVGLPTLSGVNYVGSVNAGTDDLWLKAYNGQWSNWVMASVTDTGLVTATNQTVAANQSVPLSSIFSTVGSGVTEYQVWFSDPQLGAPALGTVTNNNQPIALNQAVLLTSLNTLDYIGSATAGTDEIWLKAYDGQWSNWVLATITDTGASASLLAGSSSAADTQGAAAIGADGSDTANRMGSLISFAAGLGGGSAAIFSGSQVPCAESQPPLLDLHARG